MKQSGEQALRSVIAALVITLALTACNESMEDLSKYVAQVKQRPGEPIPPIPPVWTYTPYKYAGSVGRDPFRPSLDQGSDDERSSSHSGPRPNFDRPKEYLERYELDTMTMVGTFEKGEFNWALVRDPEGIVHRVLVGNFMGKNHGQVVSVSDTKMSLSELISDGTGGWLVREASIALGEG